MAPITEDMVPNHGLWMAVENETVQGVDFSGRDLRSFTGIDATFVDCRFERMHVDQMGFGHGFSRSFYVACSFDHSVFGATGADTARFESCTFRNVKLKGWEIHDVDLVGCVFSGTIRQCIFDGRATDVLGRPLPDRDVNEIVDNDFHDASLHQVSFIDGVDLTRQRLPEGPKYLYLDDAPAALEATRVLLSTLTEAEKERGHAFLRSYERAVESGQRQILDRASDKLRGWGEIGERIVAFWRQSSHAS